MGSNQRSLLRSSFGVAFATLLTRFLGLFRVMLEARVLGGGALAAAWQLAFMVPNLFRRLLGEGALSTALIPILTHLEQRSGLESVRKQLLVVFSALGGLLAVISIVVSVIALIAQHFATGYIKTALELLPLIMPYAVFICLVGVMTAVVNTRKIFFLAALGGMVLNLFLSAALGALVLWQTHDQWEVLLTLTVTVLLSGVVQLGIMILLLHQSGLFPIFSKASWRERGILRELFTLALPGMIGAGAVQISFMVDRALACVVGAYAVPALNYTERLVYLPIGVFAVAVGSVLMADMANAAARDDRESVIGDLELGLRQVWYFCAPLTIFLIAARFPVIRVLFQRGAFTSFCVEQTADATLFYSMGIPAFCAAKVILPAFYARKQMLLPLYVSLGGIVLNILLSTALMFPMRQGGIALATVLSSMAANGTLLFVLRRQGWGPHLRPVIETICKALIGATAASLPFWFYERLTQLFEQFWGRDVGDWWMLLFSCLLFAAIYLGVTLLIGCKEPKEMLGAFLRRRRKRRA